MNMLKTSLKGKQTISMKIEIDYNGSFAVCKITPMLSADPNEFVSFNDADKMSQIYALSAFRCIKEHWQREVKFKHYKWHNNK